ncbi:MAG TPA: hypothetical protein VGC78_13260 [Gaiellaceae bacterium]|jgi:hypothetical protein
MTDKPRRLRWSMHEPPPAKHPDRDTALVYGGLAVVIVLFAWITGGAVLRAVVIAAVVWLAATGWSVVRRRQRLTREER